MSFMVSLLILPLISSILVFFTTKFLRNIIAIFFVFLLSSISILLFVSSFTVSYNFSDTLMELFHIIDIVLLFYFLYIGVKTKQKFVLILSIVQISLYFYLSSLSFDNSNYEIISDKLSSFMYLVINIIGGLVIVYALGYIEKEDISNKRKNYFLSLLFIFIAVMNFIVSVNDLTLFFLAFELTTLCSFLLIGFRQDQQSKENSLVALWMNQIGGIAILIALICSVKFYDTIYFDTLISSSSGYFLLPVAFLIIASYVKGASYPFDKWLLGAMVAPTPVSAILHSATMVKIAPFLVLKLSSSFTEELSLVISLFGSFVFFTASLFALGKDIFKQILALSTIALLALMISVASIGSDEAIYIAMLLIFFHSLSKGLLFLQAGILEKYFHQKRLSQMENIANNSPMVLFFIVIGFASLTLPPFGAFIGKFMLLELLTELIYTNSLYILVLLFIVLGSVCLTILYFKTISKFMPKSLKVEKKEKIYIEKMFSYPSMIMLFILVVSLFFISLPLNGISLIIPFLFIVAMPFLFNIKFKNFKFSKEYNCAEVDGFEVSSYYFDFEKSYYKLVLIFSLLFIFLTLVIGGVR